MKYTLHYLEQRKSLANKALIVAQFNGIPIEQKKLTNVTDKDVQASPVKTLPFLQTDFGCIFASNSIARYIANARRDTGLAGDSFHDTMKVDSWTEFASREIEVPMSCCIFAVDGCASLSVTQAAFDQGLKDLQSALKKLEDHLKNQPYLVGPRPTLADIVVICALADGFRKVFDAKFRQPFPKVGEWFTRCTELPQFRQVLGDVPLCDKTPKITVSAEKPTESNKETTSKKSAAPKAKAAAAPTPAATAAPAAAAPTAASANAKPEDLAALEAQKLKVRDLKTAKADADEVTAAVAELKRLKELCGEVDPPKKGKKK